MVEVASLAQPIASYEPLGSKEVSDGMIHWPPFLTVMYQSKFFEGYALNRAWQELPRSVMIALVDTVRNRTLGFALDLRKELGIVSDDIEKLSPSKVDQYVTNNIFGGNNVISSNARDIMQSARDISVTSNSKQSLEHALLSLGISKYNIDELTSSIEVDSVDGKRSIGKSTAAWLTSIGGKLGEAGTSIGVDAAKGLVSQWVMQYLGLS